MKNHKFARRDHALRWITSLFVALSIGFTANAASADRSDNWMTGLNPIIGNRQLSQIRIPGSHDAGAYGPLEPEAVSVITSGVSPFLINQDRSFLKQLEAGSRHFDIRLKELLDTKFHFRHGPTVFSYSLDVALDEVATFLSTASRSKEIVILDLHNQVEYARSINPESVSRLVNLITSRLGDSLITPREVTDCASPFVGQCTVNQLSAKGNVLVFLNNTHWILSAPAVNNTFPWSLHFTEDAYSQKSLSRKEHWDYLNNAADAGLPGTGQLWTMYGQMTPIPTSPLDLARPLNPVLGAKMYNAWAQKKLNIIAYDYIGKFSHNGRTVAKLIWQSNVLQAP